MSTTYVTGSSATDATVIVIENSTVTDFASELVNLLASGHDVEGIVWDGTNYVAFMWKKYTKAF